MKTHHMAGVTLGMKNLFGLLPMPKMQSHGRLNQVLCDLSLARKPDLVIVDGLVAMEGGGSPRAAAEGFAEAGGSDLVLTFRDGLKPDRKRYPGRWPRGSRVRVPPGGDEIIFCVPYRLLYEEEMPAAAAEAVQWIEEHLGKDASVLTESPKGQLHL